MEVLCVVDRIISTNYSTLIFIIIDINTLLNQIYIIKYDTSVFNSNGINNYHIYNKETILAQLKIPKGTSLDTCILGTTQL